MRSSGKYRIDRSVLLQKAYYLLCFFFANKEISRTAHPDLPDEPFSLLEGRFFESEASRALIELAIGIRVIDDQMKQLPRDDPARVHYELRRDVADGFADTFFNDIGREPSFRETCNKIIHSDVMEPHSSEGTEAHERDGAYLYGDADEKEINWTHLSGYVRLSGRRDGKEWNFLLDIGDFVKGVCALLAEPSNAK